jgi:hypothetical protein
LEIIVGANLDPIAYWRKMHQYIGAAQVYPFLILQQICLTLYGAIRRVLPIREDIAYIDFALL